MAVQIIVKTVGTTGIFSTPQLWEDGAPTALTTAEKSAAGTFLTAAFAQSENLNFIGSGATGKLLHTDSTGPGNGTYVLYGIAAGNPASGDVVTGATSGATCVLSSSTPTDVGAIWQGQQQNQEFSGTGVQLAISGSTVSATTYKHYTTVAGASFRDHASVQSNALRYNASNGAAIRGTSVDTATITNNETTFRLSGMQVAATGAGGRAFLDLVAATGMLSEFNIFEGLYLGTSTSLGVFVTAGICRNCLIVQRGSAADHIVATATQSPFYYNCTIVAPDDHATSPTSIFMSGGAGTVTVQNCGLFAGGDKPTGAGSATFVFTTCYGDDSTPATGITAATYSSEFENVNDATRDFRLKTGAAQIDTGTTDTTNAPIDIAGTPRPQGAAYDVGCWELIAAAGRIVPSRFVRQAVNRASTY